VFGGSNRDAAIAAAKALAAKPVEISFSFRNGRVHTAPVNPAYAVLRDAHHGVYWLAPLRTTVRLRDEWVEAPHTVDGLAFEGRQPLLATPTVFSATKDMVAVVGRDTVLTPATWVDAPDDSLRD
jgi:hypothetical protein